MGILLFIAGIIYVIYKIAEEKSWDNGKAEDVDYLQMILDNRSGKELSRRETKRRYKSGYYNRKK